MSRFSRGSRSGCWLRALGFPIANLQTLEETNYLQDELIHAYDRVDLEEALENPSHPRENTCVIAAADWDHGQQAARFR